MKYLRIFTGADGRSHIEEIDAELMEEEFVPGEPPVLVSSPICQGRVMLAQLPKGWDGGRHTAPTRVLAIGLAGVLEISAGGETGGIGPGIAALVEDTTGDGHTTRVVGDEDWQGVVIALEP